MWLEAGVRLVWVIYGKKHLVEVYRPDQPVVARHDGDALTGDDVVPGFAIAVARLLR